MNAKWSGFVGILNKAKRDAKEKMESKASQICVSLLHLVLTGRQRETLMEKGLGT